MKKLIIVSFGLCLSSAVLFTACKKTNTPAITENATEPQTQSNDQAMVTNQAEEITNDASTAVENVGSVTGGTIVGGNVADSTIFTSPNFFPSPCNSTITYDTANAVRTITITYNGLNCNGTRSRTGNITITTAAGVKWKTAGAQLTIAYNNLAITRVSDGKMITINGSETITNVSGGLLRNLSSLGTITHTISSSMTIAFDNGTQRTWNIAKQRVFTYNNGIVISTTGTHTDGTTSGISDWGINRLGDAFQIAITSPMVIRQDCNFRLVSGGQVDTKLIRTITITYGLDANGNPVTCPSTSFYMKLVWTNAAGNTVTLIQPY